MGCLRLGGGDAEMGVGGRSDIPRQQVCYSVHGMISDARQDISQIPFGIESVEFRRSDQAVDVGGTFGAAIGAGE